MRRIATIVMAAPLSVGLLLGGLTAASGDPAQLAAASARTGTTEKAKVTKVKDGDTVMVKGSSKPIRLIGIDAPDMSTGDCYYGQSKRALKRKINRKYVTLSAQNKNSSSVGNGVRRPLRYIDRGSSDISLWMLRKGFGVFNNTTTEHAREIAHINEAQKAAHAGRGVWRSNLCGTGPEASLRVFVNYNADLLDPQNIPGKYIRVVNDGAPVNLNGWKMRLGNRKYFNFPNLVVETGQSIVVHNGSGGSYTKDGDHHMSWGQKIDLPDARSSRNKAGSVYIQDPQHNFRFWSMWPCIVDCTSTPAVGNLKIEAIHTPDEGNDYERVVIKNIADHAVDASFLVAEVGSSVFEIPQGHLLQPGETLTIWVDGPNGEHSLNRNPPMLSAKSGSVMLRGNDGIVIDVHRW